MSATPDRVWFITGCSSGMGRELAKAVIAKGERAVVTARHPDQLGELVSLAPERVRALPLDVTQPAQVRDAIAAGHEAFGRLDVLVNNAGQGLVGALEAITDEQIERNLATNLVGPLQLIRAALPIFRHQRSGHIFNVTAVAAFVNEVGFSVYGGTKAALEAASYSLKGELAPHGIRVTVVVPGPFRTDFIRRSLDRAPPHPAYESTVGKFAGLLSRIDGKQVGDPARAAAAILRVADEPDPPFRLVLGKYAHEKFRKQLAAIREGLDAWETVGLPTDF